MYKMSVIFDSNFMGYDRLLDHVTNRHLHSFQFPWQLVNVLLLGLSPVYIAFLWDNYLFIESFFVIPHLAEWKSISYTWHDKY